MKMRLLPCTAILVFGASLASAQAPNWYESIPNTNLGPKPTPKHPAARFGAAFAYDSWNAESVLFSGLGASAAGPITFSDMWITKGGKWIQISPTLIPPVRFCPASAFDSQRGEMVVFGGGVFIDNAIIFSLGDTWLWNGSAWSQSFPANNPVARYEAASAYDSGHQQTVLFGGVNSNGYLGDTWLWDGQNWTPQSPATGSPSPRSGASLVYQANLNVTVLFGGVGPNGSLNDTWIWDGTNWTQLHPANSPQPRYAAGFAYNVLEAQSILFAGTSETTNNLQDTWAWNGVNWVQQFPTTIPPVRFFPMMDYNEQYGMVFLFGGGQGSAIGDIYLADSWVWH
jgi:Galactose oxidase, central domain